MRVVYTDHFAVPLPPGHRFPMHKYAELRRKLTSEGVLREEELFPARPAPMEALLAVHDERYVRGYLDGQLLNEATYPRVDTVFAIAGRDDKRRELVIKALNTGPDPASMTFDIPGARLAATGQLITLASRDPLDENSFETPRKIAPVASAISGLGPRFTQPLPPYSLSILRIPIR